MTHAITSQSLLATSWGSRSAEKDALIPQDIVLKNAFRRLEEQFTTDQKLVTVVNDSIFVKKEGAFGMVLNEFVNQNNAMNPIKYLYAIREGGLEKLSFARLMFLISKDAIVSVNDCYASQTILLGNGVSYKIDGITWKAILSQASVIPERAILDLTPACFEQVLDVLYSLSKEESDQYLMNNYNICINTFKIALYFQMKDLLECTVFCLQHQVENYPVVIVEDLFSVVDRWFLFMKIKSPYRDSFTRCFESKLNKKFHAFNREDQSRFCAYCNQIIAVLRKTNE